VADDDPFDDDNPFGGLPFLGDLAKMFQSQGPVNWDAARQFALQLATDGTPEPNVDPVERVRLTELARVAELRVADFTGLDATNSGAPVQIEPVTRSDWAAGTLEAHRPLMERLAERLRAAPPDDAAAGPEAQLLGGLFQFLNPMMMAMSAGSMAGHLATRSLGVYDLPIPRAGDRIQVVATNLTEFADEWSIPVDDVRLWVCVHELTMHAVLSLGHVGSLITDLLDRYVDGFRHDPHAIEDRLSNLELGSGDPADIQQQMQQLLGDPEALLGAMRSDQQAAVVPELEALLAVVVGYVDHVIDEVGSGLIGSHDALVEAFRRRRVTASASDRFVERLLGVDLRPDLVERGHTFIAGVVERAGTEGVARLWESARTLPTPNEVDAAGLWLARIELPDDD
jgi:putative hydrolase